MIPCEVSSGFWGTQRSKRLRPTCLLGGSLLHTAQPEGKVGAVQGIRGSCRAWPNSDSCSSVSGHSSPIKVSPGDCSAQEKPVQEAQRGLCGLFPTPPNFPTWALCSWKLPRWSWLPGPRRQAVAHVATAGSAGGQDMGLYLQGLCLVIEPVLGPLSIDQRRPSCLVEEDALHGSWQLHS